MHFNIFHNQYFAWSSRSSRAITVLKSLLVYANTIRRHFKHIVLVLFAKKKTALKIVRKLSVFAFIVIFSCTSNYTRELKCNGFWWFSIKPFVVEVVSSPNDSSANVTWPSEFTDITSSFAKRPLVIKQTPIQCNMACRIRTYLPYTFSNCSLLTDTPEWTRGMRLNFRLKSWSRIVFRIFQEEPKKEWKCESYTNPKSRKRLYPSSMPLAVLKWFIRMI